MMNLFDRLRQVTLQAQVENELPDLLAERIFRIAEQPERFAAVHGEIQELIEQISQYDTFGQTGYIGMGVDHFILGSTLDRIERLVR